MILNMNDYSRVNYIDVIEPCKRTVSVEYFRYILIVNEKIMTADFD